MSQLTDLCSKYSNLKASEISRLEEMSGFLSLIADISHGRATLYVRTKETGSYLVVGEEFPKTGYNYEETKQIGKLFLKYEEPLVDLTFETGQIQCGKKQWDFMKNEAETKCFPLYFSSEKVQGALLFEWTITNFTKEELALLAQVGFHLFSGTAKVYGTLLERISYQDGVIILNEEGKVLWNNDSAGQLYKSLGVSHLPGRWYYEKLLHLKGYPRMRDFLKPLEQEYEVAHKIWRVRYFPVVVNNKLTQSVIIITDKTEFLEKEKELKIKEVLLQEMHHRIKNNLQTIAGLLRMQARRSENEEVKEALGEGIQRISSIAVAHDLLSSHLEEKVKLKDLFYELIKMNQHIGTFSEKQIHEDSQSTEIYLSIEEVNTLSLVINELLMNAVEHGYDHQVYVKWELIENKLKIYIQNKGESVLFQKKGRERLGLKIVQSLIEDSLQGSFELVYENGWVNAVISCERGEE